jgi:ABC-type uncharacterized transport system substrate-binding protein
VDVIVTGGTASVIAVKQATSTIPIVFATAGDPVRLDVIERVLNHRIKGVAGVYQRHTWEEEKTAALEALAGQIQSIIT